MTDGIEDGVGCHAPGCPDGADELAYDEMFGLNIAFCEGHIDEWAAKYHINRGGA